MLIASILFTIVIHKIMLLPCTTVDELLKPYPSNKIILAIVSLFLLVLYSSMLSAGGEVINTIFGIKKFYGTIITAATTILIIKRGYSSISDLSEILFIPIVIIIFIISITTTERSISIPAPVTITPKAILAPFIYVSYNMLTTIPLLINIPDKYLYRNCGNHVGIVIFLLSVMLMLPLYTHYSSIADSPLPLMQILSGTVKYLYEFLLILAILTTAVSSGYSLCKSAKIISYNKAVWIFSTLALVISAFGFTNIVNKVYFIFGIAGIVLLLIILFDNRKTA